MSKVINYDTDNIRVVRDDNNITFYSKANLTVQGKNGYVLINDGGNTVENLLWSEITVPSYRTFEEYVTAVQGYIDEYTAPVEYPNEPLLSLIENIQITGGWNGKPAKAFYIMGRRSAFTSTSAFNDVGEGVGNASTALFPVLTGAETIQVISSSAVDTVAGIGARKVKVVYIDTNYDLQETADISLNGTTAVTVMVGGMLQPLWFENTEVGSGGASAGNITLRTSAPLTLSQIVAGGNKSMDAIFMVPDGYTAYVPKWGGSSIQNTQDLRLRATVNTLDRSLSSIYHFQDNRYAPSNTSYGSELPSLKYPARCMIKVSTISSSTAAATRCDADFTVIIIQD